MGWSSVKFPIRSRILRLGHTCAMSFLLSIFFLTSCALPPRQSMESAHQAVERARAEASSPECMQLVESAEQALKNAKEAFEKKKYETAKTEAFQTLRTAFDAHKCAENEKEDEHSGQSD